MIGNVLENTFVNRQETVYTTCPLTCNSFECEGQIGLI